VPAPAKARARIIARQELILCGLSVAGKVFRLHDDRVRFQARARDGALIKTGAEIAIINGPARSLLESERVALNFLQQLSGIATLTRRYVRATGRHKTRIVATRKTHPGLRGLEKYAVVVGGGLPHRIRLDDGILIKDNHLALSGSISGAIKRAKQRKPEGLRVEVEVNTLSEFKEALSAGADIIMLDNMSPALMKKAVAFTRGIATDLSAEALAKAEFARTDRVLLEASGGITLANLKRVAASGVDLISVGALTHSAPAVDISMEVEPIHVRRVRRR
jgi:nicotinate-nucleotide pyrophosphorylase (carboxylating)